MSKDIIKSLEDRLKQTEENSIKKAIEKKIESIKKGSVTK